MSDSRQDAQAALDQSGIEDSLGAALSTSFSIPPAQPKPKPAPAATAPAESAPDANAAAAAPAPDDWKDEYEARLSEWRAEADVARAKAEAVRQRFIDDAAAAAKAATDAAEAAKRAEAEARAARERDDKLRRALADSSAGASGSRYAPQADERRKEAREKKVREAWEVVRGAGEVDEHEVVTDARGVMPQDAGIAGPPGETRHASHAPASPSQPLPPNLGPPSPLRAVALSESATLDRRSATSAAWTEVSAPSSAAALSPASSAASEPRAAHGHVESVEPAELKQEDTSYAQLPSTDADKPTAAAAAAPAPASATAAAAPVSAPESASNPPPSLTLSLFTQPGQLSWSRLAAVLGINLVLPFINGVALGFGEIFAREAVKAGRLWWRGDRAIFGWTRGGQDGARRGTATVGLSGSGGFP
ncbi:hypothetical protein Q5752_006933 [Cryptotrichosporon argae]